MSLYGEGLYVDAAGRRHAVAERSQAQLQQRQWELHGPNGEPLIPVPTPEDKPAMPSSVYALSKQDQERLALMLGQAYGIPTVALRFFNVYGAHQSLSNPYTGVLAIFASRLLNGRPPVIFEDGEQRRDFLEVRDVARACELALDRDAAAGLALNVGSGCSYSIREIAARLAAALGREDIQPEVSGRFRTGDVRHCFADMTLARDRLGFEPAYSLEDGLAELAGWLEGRTSQDRVEAARQELDRQGLWL
jgi:dTDP-L-rhamnose 4-epimerase